MYDWFVGFTLHSPMQHKGADGMLVKQSRGGGAESKRKEREVGKSKFWPEIRTQKTKAVTFIKLTKSKEPRAQTGPWRILAVFYSYGDI